MILRQTDAISPPQSRQFQLCLLIMETVNMYTNLITESHCETIMSRTKTKGKISREIIIDMKIVFFI